MGWTVDCVMTFNVITVHPDTPFKEMVRLTHQFGISAVPVVEESDGKQRVVGVVSQADLLLNMERRSSADSDMAEVDGEDHVARTAAELMTSPAITIGPGSSLRDAALVMHGHRIKRLPVVDEVGNLIGLVSRSDLMRSYDRTDQSIVQEIEERIVNRLLKLDNHALEIGVSDGAVTLSGSVGTKSLANVLTWLVNQVAGVVEVDHSQLSWQVDDSAREAIRPTGSIGGKSQWRQGVGHGGTRQRPH